MNNKRKEFTIEEKLDASSHQITGRYYEGTIPSPEMMKQYREIDPNLPMRMLQIT